MRLLPPLIPNWRTAPRMLSMWCFAGIAGLSGAWLGIGWVSGEPFDPGPGGHRAVLVLAILGAVLRLVAQPSLAEERAADALGL
jgi:hypothetical protein